MSLIGKRIAVIGYGTMGQALVGALLSDGAVAATDLTATVGHQESAERLDAEHEFKVGTDNAATVAAADLVLLCVKPGVLRISGRPGPWTTARFWFPLPPASPPASWNSLPVANWRWYVPCPTHPAWWGRA